MEQIGEYKLRSRRKRTPVKYINGQSVEPQPKEVELIILDNQESVDLKAAEDLDLPLQELNCPDIPVQIDQTTITGTDDFELVVCGLCRACFMGESRFDMLTRHKKSEHRQKVESPVTSRFVQPDDALNLHSDTEICALNKNDKKEKPVDNNNDDHLKKPHRCEFCDSGFVRADTLKMHKKTVHFNDTLFKCKLLRCGKSFTSSSHLRRHNETVHKKLRPYRCLHCDRTFGQSYHLKRHLEAVHIKLKRHGCGHCNKKFGDYYRLKKHIDLVHNIQESKSQNCCKLESHLSGFSGKKNHMKKVHDKVADVHHRSDRFETSFTQEPDLTLHNKDIPDVSDQQASGVELENCPKMESEKVIGKPRLYPCILCSKSFTQAGKLKIHITVVHNNLKKYQCSFCDKRFGYSRNLRSHIKTVHEKSRPFSCDQCGNSFKESRKLRVHIRTVHEKSRPFSCDECGKSFKESRKLRVHISTVHEVLRPFSCDHCDKSYKESRKLRAHIRAVHENIKPHQCSSCDAKFEYRYLLIRHIHTKHSNNTKVQ